jgi:hypothetical protein
MPRVPGLARDWAAAKLLDGDLGEVAVAAIADKLGNPLAALADELWTRKFIWIRIL